MNYLVTDKETVDGFQFDTFSAARDAAQNDDMIIVPVIDLRPLMVDNVLTYEEFSRNLERTIFQAMIDEENGSPSRAARRLGMHHQTLLYRLDHHYRDTKRSKKRARRTPILNYSLTLTSYDAARRSEVSQAIRDLQAELNDESDINILRLPVRLFTKLSHTRAAYCRAQLHKVGAKIKMTPRGRQ